MCVGFLFAFLPKLLASPRSGMGTEILQERMQAWTSLHLTLEERLDFGAAKAGMEYSDAKFPGISH